MIQVTTVGRVTADLELKEGANKSPYLKFDLAVAQGYGEGRHTVFLQCWAFGDIAKRMEAAHVKKGSQLMIAGDLDVVEFERKDGTKGRANKVTVKDWQFIGRGEKSEGKQAKKEGTKPKTEYPEHYCGDDEDLPL